MPDNTDSSDYPSLETTRSERKKAKVVAECVKTILKCFRVCKNKKTIHDVQLAKPKKT